MLGAAGSKRTAILATLDAGPIAVLFAATHPEVVSALILVNTTDRYLAADDYSIGASPDFVDVLVETFAKGYGTPELTRLFNPGRADGAEYVRLVSKMIRSSATPRTAAAQYSYILRSVDVRHALPLIQAPTLVLQVSESPFLSVAQGRYLADHIEGATFIEVPGGNVSMDAAPVLDIAEFLTCERPVVEVERILITVLFTGNHSGDLRAESANGPPLCARWSVDRWCAWDLGRRTASGGTCSERAAGCGDHPVDRGERPAGRSDGSVGGGGRSGLGQQLEAAVV